MERRTKKTNTPGNARSAVVIRLLSMAELFRTKAKITDEAEEALEWEKKLRARAEELKAA